jgi:hypothetical protein
MDQLPCGRGEGRSPLHQGRGNADTSEAKALLEPGMGRTRQRFAILACYWCRTDGAIDGIRDSCKRGWELETVLHLYHTDKCVLDQHRRRRGAMCHRVRGVIGGGGDDTPVRIVSSCLVLFGSDSIGGNTSQGEFGASSLPCYHAERSSRSNMPRRQAVGLKGRSSGRGGRAYTLSPVARPGRLPCVYIYLAYPEGKTAGIISLHPQTVLLSSIIRNLRIFAPRHNNWCRLYREIYFAPEAAAAMATGKSPEDAFLLSSDEESDFDDLSDDTGNQSDISLPSFSELCRRAPKKVKFGNIATPGTYLSLLLQRAILTCSRRCTLSCYIRPRCRHQRRLRCRKPVGKNRPKQRVCVNPSPNTWPTTVSSIAIYLGTFARIV